MVVIASSPVEVDIAAGGVISDSGGSLSAPTKKSIPKLPNCNGGSKKSQMSYKLVPC